MAEIVRMPKLSDTMTDGVVAVWHKKVGDTVKSGELLAEIETDKATMEFESFQDGVLLHIGCEKGVSAPVDSILAILGKAGEDVSALIASEKDNKPAAPASAPAATPVPAPKAETKAPAPAPVAAKAAVAPRAAAPAPVESNGRIFVSPLAKKLADERHININKLRGSGEGGRVVKRDIDNFNPGSSVAQVESVAMAVEDGLIVPVVKFANSKSVQEISAQVKDFSARAKAKKLSPDEYAGSTFTISNLGMFGLEEFTAIINSPNACILAVGAIRQVPVVKNNAVVPGNMMKVTLSCDHRVVDGATGAAFLQTLKKSIENPVLIFM